jgi:hypothetical protein
MPWVIRVEPCVNGFLVIFQSQTLGLVQWNCTTPADVSARIGELLGIPAPTAVPDAFWKAWEPPTSDGHEKWLAKWREIGGAT